MSNGYSRFLGWSWVVAAATAVVLAMAGMQNSFDAFPSNGIPRPANPDLAGGLFVAAICFASYAVLAFVAWIAVRAIAGFLADGIRPAADPAPERETLSA